MSIADKAKGKLKEAAGSVTGSVDLRREGKAQWHKGHHQAQADEARMMAEKHELEAELFEHEERRHHPTRDDVPSDVPEESRPRAPRSPSSHRDRTRRRDLDR